MVHKMDSINQHKKQISQRLLQYSTILIFEMFFRSKFDILTGKTNFIIEQGKSTVQISTMRVMILTYRIFNNLFMKISPLRLSTLHVALHNCTIRMFQLFLCQTQSFIKKTFRVFLMRWRIFHILYVFGCRLNFIFYSNVLKYILLKLLQVLDAQTHLRFYCEIAFNKFLILKKVIQR